MKLMGKKKKQHMLNIIKVVTVAAALCCPSNCSRQNVRFPLVRSGAEGHKKID